MRAAAYARVSSAQQREAQSIESQLRVLPSFIAARGWQLIGTYVDDGRSAASGKLAKREGLARLLTDLAAGRIDVVVVADMDRVTRSEDLEERGRILGAIQRARAKLASAGSGQILDLSSSEGDLLSSLQAFFAAEWVRKHREKILRGRELAVSRGRKPAGATPYGYSYDPATGRLAPHPEQAEVVREIYRRVAAGQSARGVGDDLEHRGVPSSRGGRWGANLARLVRAPIYRGEWTVDAKRAHRLAVPPLVSDDVWFAAQATLDAGALRGLRRTRHVYLCEGLITCGVCGAAVHIHRESARNAGRRGAYYRCSSRRWPRAGHPPCTLPMVQTQAVDERVWRALSGLLQRPDLVELLAAQLSGEGQTWDRDAAEARARLAELQRAEEALLERFTRGLVGEAALDVQLVRIRDRRRWLDGQAARAGEAGAEARRAAHAGLDAAALVAELRGRLEAATAEERRTLVRVLVPGPGRITLGNDRSLEIRAILAPCAGASGSGEVDARDHGRKADVSRDELHSAYTMSATGRHWPSAHVSMSDLATLPE